MDHQCVRISNRAIYVEIEKLYPYAQKALLNTVKELEESGRISGIQSDIDEYVGVDVEVYKESVGYLSTTVKHIVSFFRYTK